ncbi:MAG: hypothetical protein A49_06080 [Methyloceanibacter sp.]|nr:MAG: hypothetical protein A49_06080 [Methyloceanibacter sp.]
MANRAYYDDRIQDFLSRDSDAILGALTRGSVFPIETSQRNAWLTQIDILRETLAPYAGRGKMYFEYAVPRLGKRIDVLLLIDHVLIVVEFKVGEAIFSASATDQVFDYALDLKNFHETSHDKPIAPVLVATGARHAKPELAETPRRDGLLQPVHATVESIGEIVRQILAFCRGRPIDPDRWEQGRYKPTPTIIEAATALYRGHSVTDISRSDASAINLQQTTSAIAEIIRDAKEKSKKSICFVTGVPGAGKTLVGLNIATKYIDRESELYSVFLSGNGPLVAILREALARDKVRREAEAGRRFRKGQARSEVKLFIQNIHHFRDECLIDSTRPPIEHVALFDEAQRAWNREQTANFMLRRKQLPGFGQSEPEFLISCLDRHADWAVIVCLVGGGQEINTGEAGIGEWIRALMSSFPAWSIHISSQLHDEEYGAGEVLRACTGEQMSSSTINFTSGSQ